MNYLIAIEIAVILVLLIANGLFAMTEMAVVSARKGRLRSMIASGNRGAQFALHLAETPNRFLPSVQLGITLIGLLAGAFGGATIAEQLAIPLSQVAWLKPYAEATALGIVVVLLTFVSLLIGELVPKRLALAHPERIASVMARPMDWLSRAARPVVWLLGRATDGVLWLLPTKTAATEAVSEDEVKDLMHEGTQAGVFHPAESSMVESVLSFDQRPVTDIMTPRGKVTFLRSNEEPEMLWHKIVVSGRSHFPVHDGCRDRIVGVVSVKAIYANAAAGVRPKVGDLMVKPLVVAADQTVAGLLEMFKRTGQHIGIICDDRQQFLGVVSLVDVLEAIVGEIPSLEERLKPEARSRPDGTWLVDGRFDVARLWRLVGVDREGELLDNEKQTVADFVSNRLSVPRVEGATVQARGWSFEVLDIDGDRIDKVLLSAAKEKR